MPSILDDPLPQPPQALDGLSDAQIAAAFLTNAPLWIKGFKDTSTHLHDVHLYAVHLQDQLDKANELRDRGPAGLPSPARSEPPTGMGAELDGQTRVWVDLFTVSISGSMATGPISSIIVMPDAGRKPFTVMSPSTNSLDTMFSPRKLFAVKLVPAMRQSQEEIQMNSRSLQTSLYLEIRECKSAVINHSCEAG